MRKTVVLILAFFMLGMGTIYGVEGLSQIIISQFIIERDTVEVYFDVIDEEEEQISVNTEDLEISVVDSEGNPCDYLVDSLNQSSDDGVGYVLAIDLSTSINGFDTMKSSIETIIENMNSNDRIALLTFGDEVAIPQKFTGNKEELTEALDSLVADQRWTKLYTGLKTAITYSRTASSDIPERRVIILYSDGYDYNTGGETKLDVIKELDGARSYPIYALQSDPNNDEEKIAKIEDLAEVVQISNGKFITVAGKGIEECYNQIYSSINSEYYLTLQMNAEPGDYVINISSDYDGLELTDSLKIYLNRELTMEASEDDTEIIEEDDEVDIIDTENTEQVESEDSSDDKTSNTENDKSIEVSDDDDKPVSTNESGIRSLGLKMIILLGVAGVLILLIIVLLIIFVVSGKKKKKVNKVRPQVTSATTIQGRHVLLKPFETNKFKGLSIDISKQIIVGSDRNTCDLVYDFDSEVKGQHFILELEGDRLYIFNMTVDTETYINGFPLEGKREILSDDIIAFGTIEVQIIF